MLCKVTEVTQKTVIHQVSFHNPNCFKKWIPHLFLLFFKLQKQKHETLRHQLASSSLH